MRLEILTVLLPVSLVAAACSGSDPLLVGKDPGSVDASQDGAGGSADASVEGAGGQAGEFTCSSPRLPIEGTPCDETTDCGPALDCNYKAGCSHPTGTCERWARCPDDSSVVTYCGCDGMNHDGGGPQPWSQLGFCEAGTDAPEASTCPSPGQTSCSGACVDLLSDSQNCGACAHDCLAGACASGACQPVLLASGSNPTTGIAIDLDYVYWTSQPFQSSGDPPAGTVMKVAKSGGAPVAVATAQDYPAGIAVDSTNAYWTNSTDLHTWPTGNPPAGSVMKVAKAGGVPFALATSLDAPWAIAVDSTSAYWTNLLGSAVVFSVSTSGGAPAAIADGRGPGIAVDSTSVYYENNLNLLKVPISGGTPTVLATVAKGLSDTANIVVDSNSAYFVGCYLCPPDIMKVDKGGGTPVHLITQSYPDLHSIFGIAIDSTYIYGTTCNKTVSVFRVPLAGGAAEQIAATDAHCFPGPIAVDSTAIYWLQGGGVAKLAK